MTATKLRLVLLGVVAVLVLGLGAGAYFVLGLLADRAHQTDHTKADADTTSTELQQLKSLEKQLEDQADIVSRAKEIAATTAQYKYQDQVISDISVYASRYGIKISTFDFSAAQSAKPDTSGGAKKTPFTLTLKGPIPFVTFIRFLQDIERNLTKIQVTSLTLSPDKNPNNIANPTIGLEVYLNN
jgi:hypothetical protein